MAYPVQPGDIQDSDPVCAFELSICFLFVYTAHWDLGWLTERGEKASCMLLQLHQPPNGENPTFIVLLGYEMNQLLCIRQEGWS